MTTPVIVDQEVFVVDQDPMIDAGIPEAINAPIADPIIVPVAAPVTATRPVMAAMVPVMAMPVMTVMP